MMAATKRGVCFVQFDKTEERLLNKLQVEFPNAVLQASHESSESALDQWMTALAEHLKGLSPLPQLPLDIRSTAFQLKVWKFLLSVKSGDTVSYSEVAKGIGSPKGVRAAANACGKNKIAMLIPYHRVLRADGGLGGYEWAANVSVLYLISRTIKDTRIIIQR